MSEPLMSEARPAWLEHHLRALPREIEPESDLWPDVANRIRKPRTPRWLAASAAASVLLSAAAAFFAWQAVHPSPPTEQLDARDMLMLSYRDASASYAAQWAVARPKMDPTLAAEIDRNLAIIRSAVESLDSALARSPNDPALRGLLQSTLADEIALYRRASVLAPAPI